MSSPPAGTWQALAQVPRTYQCWDCGRAVRGDEVRRSEVAGFHGRSQRVNLCPDCFPKHRRRSRITNVLGFLVFAASVGLIFSALVYELVAPRI